MARLLRRLQNLDDRIIYLIIGICILAPLVRPLNLPLSPGAMTVSAYDTIDSLPPGSRILLITEIAPGGESELLPQLVVFHRHAMSKGLRIIYCSTNPASVPYLLNLTNEWNSEYSTEYGEQYVILPFMAGEESVVVQIGQNFSALYESDYYCTPLKDMEIMDGIEGISDMDLVLSVGGGDLFRWVLRHIQVSKGVPTVVGCTAVITSFVSPFYSSGQCAGILSGLGGAAEYESLANLPGKATAGMDAQSLGHLVLILMILLGNAGTIAARKTFVEIPPLKRGSSK